MTEAKGLSLLEIRLLTGRKHQIRVHFSELGHPLVGDRKYGVGDGRSRQLALHARGISFIHPFNKRSLSFETAMPEEFSRLLGKL